MAGLLQGAGFTLPTVDIDTITVCTDVITYPAHVLLQNQLLPQTSKHRYIILNFNLTFRHTTHAQYALHQISYPNAIALMEHLVNMGEGSASLNRSYAVGTDTFLAMAALYQGNCSL